MVTRKTPKESQNKRLLKRLQEGKRVDPLSAWSVLGIYRLSARIHDLREEGHKIETERIQVKNQFNETITVANYTL